MITFNYSISDSWNSDLRGMDISSADEMALRYDLFLGDIVMIVDCTDFSTRWGWVPVLDFAASLFNINSKLKLSKDTSCKEIFEFTDSGAEIFFQRIEEKIFISANYTSGESSVLFEEFQNKTETFVKTTVMELTERYKGLQDNEFLPIIFPFLLQHGRLG